MTYCIPGGEARKASGRTGVHLTGKLGGGVHFLRIFVPE
jgi:hypothetical protein